MCAKNNPYTPTKGNELGDSHTFNVDTPVFSLTKTKNNGKSKKIIVSEISTSNKSDFYICERLISTGHLKPIIKLFDSG